MKNRIFAFIAVALLTPVLVAQAKQGGNIASKTFKVASDTKILAADNKAVALADLKVGDKVGLAYTERNGALTAQTIHIMADAKSQKGANKAEHKSAKSEAGTHARGVITSIDKTAGTITVDVKEGHKKS